MLQPYEGVVAAQTGHVSTHEAGAIEFTGHKVLTLPEKNGKICAADLKNLIETFYGDEIMSIWYFREWSIFLTRQNMEHCIQKKN